MISSLFFQFLAAFFGTIAFSSIFQVPRQILYVLWCNWRIWVGDLLVVD